MTTGSGPQFPPPTTAPRSFETTFLADPPAVRTPSGRRRVARTALVAVPALLLVAGLSSFVTALVVRDHPAAAHHSGTTAAAGQVAGKQAGKKANHGAQTVGTLTAQNGSTWTVRLDSGRTVTVDVSAATHYGTKAAPAQENAFHDGDLVRVSGRDAHGTVHATRVATAPSSRT